MNDEHKGTIGAAVAEAAREERVRNVVFAAPADDPRARRPADVFTLVTAGLVALFLAWMHRSRVTLDVEAQRLFEDVSLGVIDTILRIVFLGGGLFALSLLVAILLYGKGRRAVARDMALAGLLAAVLAVLGSLLAGPEWPDLLPEFVGAEDVPSYPLIRLAVAMAILNVATPYLAVPMRRLGTRLMALMALSALLLGFGDVSSILGGLAVGIAAAAAIHLIFGSGMGIPSKARILDAMRAIQLDPVTVSYLDEQRGGATLVRGALADDSDVLVKILGRDSVDAGLYSRLWRWMWYRDQKTALLASGLQQVEHEGILLLEAERAGAPVPTLVGWGVSESGDALIVTPWTGGRHLADIPASEIDDAMLGGCWDALARLHDAGIAHGAIDGRQITASDGRVQFDDLSQATVTPDAETRSADVAQMLVTHAVAVGSERAIGAARTRVGDATLADALPVLQAGALSKELNEDVKRSEVKLKQLRADVAGAIDTDAPELVQLQRVTWGNLAMVALTFVAAYALIGSLADIGFDTIVEQFEDAKWSWVITALILAQLTNVGEFFSLTGAVSRTVSVPFGPTMMFRYALSYVSLAIPGQAGALAMNIRYMQKLGVSTAKAVAQGPLLTVFSIGFDIILFLIALQFVGSDALDNSGIEDADFGPALRLLLLLVAAVVVGVVVTLLVPKLRNRVVPHVKEGFRTVKTSITDPERLLRVAGGTLLQKVLFALTLAASVAAFGDSITLAEAIFVNSAVSLFIGLIPVPGGVGVGETALAAGLVLVGVPEGAAFGAALSHRMVTAYLPPVFGWYASRWLTQRDYL